MMFTIRVLLSIALALTIGACAGTSPTQPSPAATHNQSSFATFGLPIVLSGQSNAVNLRPELAAIYTPGVISVSEANQRIREWAVDGHLWQQLEPELHRPLTAFVWWQGETDGFEAGTAAAYQDRLPEFLARVRHASEQPHLLIVVVQVLAYHPAFEVWFDQIREAQRRVVAGDPDSVLISVDDCPGDGQAHLVFPDGYVPAADRILATIRARSN